MIDKTNPYEANIKEIYKETVKKYDEEYYDTPFEHSTTNCYLLGGVDALRHLDIDKIIEDEDVSIGCYINGMIQALHEFKELTIIGEVKHKLEVVEVR